MIDLSPAQSALRVGQLLQAKEGRHLDFKRISAKLTRIVEAVCAFANSEGGIVAIGIGDAKDVKVSAPPTSRLFGIEENAEALDELQRELMKRFAPAIGGLHWNRLSCTLHNGQPGHVVLLRVEKSDKVHSIIGNGTWTRMEASNRELSAEEIAELCYRRGVRSASSETVPVKLSLLETATWRTFVQARGLRDGEFAEQLMRIGLAEETDGDVRPTRAAVLLFSEEPGSLLAAHGTRADIRLMIYAGKAAVPGATPNLRKQPLTIRGPLITQIDAAKRAVLGALTEGITLSGSGFKTRHLYPERVVTEAIVNAVIHRDYRLNRDIFIRIFDDRIEVESPGVFPGNITPSTISKAGSKARNPLIAQNLREFPVAPNIDAGEGVRMMFAEMAAAKLYPPQYGVNVEQAEESVTVTLLNHERPTIWDQVSHWIDTNGPIANSDLCAIAEVDTLKASQMLRRWVEQGVLERLVWRGKRNMAYVKPQRTDDQWELLPEASKDDQATD